jgi:hypothetical protein
VNDELKRMCNYAVVRISKTLSQQLAEVTKKNHRSIRKERQPSGQESNPGLSKYETGVLTTDSKHLARLRLL